MHHPKSFDTGISAFYSGKSVFITGGTGFMGKVLIERLLTSCPRIKNIFLLIREKGNISPEQRLQQIIQNQVFDVLRARDPGQLDKLVAVAGDITRKHIGITPTALNQLAEVSIVFSSAASVKLQEELKRSVDQNLRSIIAMLEICDTLPNIDVFVHVSTAYSNAELQVVEERVYPPPADLATLLRLLDEGTECQDQLRKLTAAKPNTYTFTKAMAEHVVDKHGCHNFSTAIFRPTVVISSLQHPFPGWIENWNGPSGIIAAAITGLLRVFRANRVARADLLPVDIAIDTLIAVAWETALDKPSKVRVYNCTTMENPTTWGDLHLAANTYTPLYPSRRALMSPHCVVVNNRYTYWILEKVLQTIPLYTIEYLKRFFRVKTDIDFIQMDRYLQTMREILEYFTLIEWHFEHENTRNLRERLSAEDKAIFNLDPKTINWAQLYVDFVRGTRRYVLQEKDEDLEAVRAKMRLLNLIHTAMKVLLTVVSLRLISHWNFVQNCFKQLLHLLRIIISESAHYPKFLTISQF